MILARPVPTPEKVSPMAEVGSIPSGEGLFIAFWPEALGGLRRLALHEVALSSFVESPLGRAKSGSEAVPKQSGHTRGAVQTELSRASDLARIWRRVHPSLEGERERQEGTSVSLRGRWKCGIGRALNSLRDTLPK